MKIPKNSILLMTIILTLFAAVKISYADCPIIYIDARGKTGTEIGMALGQEIKARYPDIEQVLDNYLYNLIYDQSVFDYYGIPRVNAIMANIEQKYKDEVSGLASLLTLSATDKLGDGHLSVNELWALQLIPDILRDTNCSGFGVFGDYSASDSPIVGRNLDWWTTAGIRGLQAIVVYEYQDRTLVNIGFAGFVGVITGFNDEGLFAGILDSPMDNAYPNPIGKRSYVFDLRNALETCTTISEASALLYPKPYAFSHNILFADRIDIQVLEHPQGVTGLLRTSGSQLNPDLSWGKTNQIAVVNFFTLPGFVNERYDSNTLRWNRLKDLAIFNTINKANAEEVESVMLDTANYYSIFNSQTVQSMVFSPADRKLYLYTMPVSGIHPAVPAMERVTILSFTRGDINDDGFTDLIDLLLVLRSLAGFNTDEIRSDYPSSGADVNADNKVGIEEAIYILGKMTGIR